MSFLDLRSAESGRRGDGNDDVDGLHREGEQARSKGSQVLPLAVEHQPKSGGCGRLCPQKEGGEYRKSRRREEEEG